MRSLQSAVLASLRKVAFGALQTVKRDTLAGQAPATRIVLLGIRLATLPIVNASQVTDVALEQLNSALDARRSD